MSPNVSKCLQMSPNVSKCLQMSPNYPFNIFQYNMDPLDFVDLADFEHNHR